jgi:formylglycine-generating enzyme
MVDVAGKMRLISGGDYLQQGTCKNWINKDFPERCAEFDKDKWNAITEKLPQRDMHYCIDRFEFPNVKGESPVILVDFNESAAMCKERGKRMCTEDEWTFACEGEEALPYPYGYVRDVNACLVDKTWKQWEGSWARGRGRNEAMLEIDRLWQGVPSGSMPKCKSPFGVYDLTGNVDEWTRATSGGNPAILKGGYWGPVRTRCRPSTRVHKDFHVLYQQGFRCCTDPNAAAAAPAQ